MGVKCLAQEHNAVPRPGLEPGPFDPESSALTIRPPRLPSHPEYCTLKKKVSLNSLFLSNVNGTETSTAESPDISNFPLSRSSDWV